MRTLLRCAAVAVLTIRLAAQTTPSPSAPTPDGRTVFHATARLVVVDVTVTDINGAPVRGLSKAAFHLTESSNPQVIRSFEEHSFALNAAAAASLPPLQPGVFTNLVSASPQSPPTVLLLDMLNTPMQNQAWIRQKLLDYLSTAPPNARIAIFALNSQLTLLQGFTSDTALLRSAIEHVHPEASPVLGEKIGGDADIVANMHSGNCPLGSHAINRLNCEVFAETEQNTDEDQRASTTLQAFHQLALYLAGQPGRKNLIWFSAAFPLALTPSDAALQLPGIASADVRTGTARWMAEYRETIDLLSRSRVAIYPFDARGIAFRNNASPTETRTAMFATQSAMSEMADDSGGKAFINTNGFSAAMQEIFDNGSSYYTVSYTPSDASAHGEFRPIAIKLDNTSGYKLAYRRGYYAEPADPAIKTASATTPGSAMQMASSYLVPPSTQIAFFARVLRMDGDATQVAAPSVVAANVSSGAKPDAKNSRRFSIEYSADLSNFAIATTPDEVRHAHVEFIVLAYDSQGRVIRSDVKPVRIAWTPEQFTSARQHGVRYQQQISLPADNSATVRVFIHDLSNDHVGSMDIPVASIKPN